MTNEERFVASCQSMGEADVRQKLSADRYSNQKAVWASNWLEQVESGKSDATKIEESTRNLLKAKPNRHVAFALSGLLFVLLLVSVAMFLKLN
jgi:hypothetical protein